MPNGQAHFAYNGTVIAAQKPQKLIDALSRAFVSGANAPPQVLATPAKPQGQCQVVGCPSIYHNFRACPVFLNYFQKSGFRVPDTQLTPAMASSMATPWA